MRLIFTRFTLLTIELPLLPQERERDKEERGKWIKRERRLLTRLLLIFLGAECCASFLFRPPFLAWSWDELWIINVRISKVYWLKMSQTWPLEWLESRGRPVYVPQIAYRTQSLLLISTIISHGAIICDFSIGIPSFNRLNLSHTSHLWLIRTTNLLKLLER